MITVLHMDAIFGCEGFYNYVSNRSLSFLKENERVLEPSKINQTRWEWHHTPFLLCHFANYAHHKTLYMQLAKQALLQATKWFLPLEIGNYSNYTHQGH